MHRILLTSVVVAVAVAATPLAAQTLDTAAASPEHQAYRAKQAWLLRDGGKWSADNPTFDSTAEGSPRSFGYQFTQGWGADVMRLKITGRVGEKTYLYWDGFYYWHPVKNRLMYVAQGTGGAIAAGESVDAAGTLAFEIITPDGTVALHRDGDTRLSDEAFQSQSFRYTASGWTPNQTLTWRRVNE
ncbi:MAG: hypothetical protein OER21_08880 [Gemmatimonadota bacterium]|nr:hypothetical protein [Gemmatimonadota bacterium]